MNETITARLIKLQGPLTIEEFSKKLGVPYASLHSYLVGKKGRKPSIPSAIFLEKVIKNTRVNPLWLLTGEGPMFREEEPPKIPDSKEDFEEISEDHKIRDINAMLADDPEGKQAVYEFLQAKKNFDRASRSMKEYVGRKISVWFDFPKNKNGDDPPGPGQP